MKKCSKCGQAKPRERFSKNSKAPDGRFSYCKPCASAYSSAWNKAHPDRVAVTEARRQKKRNAERKRDPEAQFKDREKSLMKKYGMSVAEFDDMLAKQNGRCLICAGVPRGNGAWHVDHDHQCCLGPNTCGGCIRGVLCGPCNTQLGWFEDNHEAIVAYLKDGI